jgi:tRNA(adenine34) deaminase
MELYTLDYFMREALKEAHKALEKGEVPVGAVVVCQNKIIARAHNQTEQLNDATASNFCRKLPGIKIFK